MPTMATRAQAQTIRTYTHNTTDPGMKPGMERAHDAVLLEEMTSGMEEIDVPEMPDALGVQVDDPVFYADLDHAVERAHQCQQYTEQIQAKLKALLGAAEAHRQACHDLGMLLATSSREFKLRHTENDPEPLKACSELLKEFDAAFAESTATMYDIVDVKLNRVSQKFKTLIDCREQMIQSHNKYTTTITKFCGTGFGDDGSASEDFHRRSHKAYASKKAAHLTALNTVDVLHEIMSLTKVDVVKQTLEAVMAEANFFTRGAKITQAHTPKMNARQDILQNVQLRAEGAHTLELQRLEKIRQEVLSCYEQEVALIPRDFERSHGLSATLKRAVRKQDGSSPKRSGISRKTSASRQWRKSRRRGTAETADDLKDAQGVSSKSCTRVGQSDGTPAAGGGAQGPTTSMTLPHPSLHALRRKRGYMFRRMEKKWRLDYLAIDQHRLVRVGDTGTTEELVNLLLSTIRAGDNASDERHHCLTVITPSNRLQLQALGPKDYNEWLLALQQGIADALDSGNADNRDDLVVPDHVSLLTSIQGNDKCADCGALDTEWASINLGILLCIECSGVHRSLGVHISKVRSVNLDRWGPDTLKFMQGVGNSRFNQRYEGNLHLTGDLKPTSSTSKSERIAYIRRKHIDRAYEDTSAPDPLTQAAALSTNEEPLTARSHDNSTGSCASASERNHNGDTDENSIGGSDSDAAGPSMEERLADDLAEALRKRSHVDVEHAQRMGGDEAELELEQLRELSQSSEHRSSFSASSTAGTFARLVRNAATRRKPSPGSRRRRHRASAPAHTAGNARGLITDEEEQSPSPTATSPSLSTKHSRFRPHTPRMLKRFSLSNAPSRRDTEPSARKLESWLNHLQGAQSEGEEDDLDQQMERSCLPSPQEEQPPAFCTGSDADSHHNGSRNSSNRSHGGPAERSGAKQFETNKAGLRLAGADSRSLGMRGVESGSGLASPTLSSSSTTSVVQAKGRDQGDAEAEAEGEAVGDPPCVSLQQTSAGTGRPKRHQHQHQRQHAVPSDSTENGGRPMGTATMATKTALAPTTIAAAPTPVQATKRHMHQQPVRRHQPPRAATGVSRSVKHKTRRSRSKRRGTEQGPRGHSAANETVSGRSTSPTSTRGNEVSLFSQLIARERELTPSPTPPVAAHHAEESVLVQEAGSHTLNASADAHRGDLGALLQCQPGLDSDQQGNSGASAPVYFRELEDHSSPRICQGHATTPSTSRDPHSSIGRPKVEGHQQGRHQAGAHCTGAPSAVLKARGSTPAYAGGKAAPQHTQTVLGASLDTSTLRKLHSSGETHQKIPPVSSSTSSPPSSPTRPRRTSRSALQASAGRSTAL